MLAHLQICVLQQLHLTNEKEDLLGRCLCMICFLLNQWETSDSWSLINTVVIIVELQAILLHTLIFFLENTCFFENFIMYIVQEPHRNINALKYLIYFFSRRTCFSKNFIFILYIVQETEISMHGNVLINFFLEKLASPRIL